jgi:hypothetical protein
MALCVQGDYRCGSLYSFGKPPVVVSLEALIVDSTFFASCEIGRHPQRDYDEK